MSTRSDISILNPDGSVQTQYIHFDGYLAHNGQILLNSYQTMNDAKKILDLSAYQMDSSLPETPNMLDETLKDKEKTNDTPVYHNNLKSFKDDLTKSDEYADGSKHLNKDTEYHYLFAPNNEEKYQWHTINRDGVKPLTQNAINEEEKQSTNSYNSTNWSRGITGTWGEPLSTSEMEGLDRGLYSIGKNLVVFKTKELNHSKTIKSHKFDREAWKKKHEKTIDQMQNGLLKEVENYTETPEQMLELLKFTDKFHQYSARNAILIHLQRPSAGAVASYKKFKDMGYSVQKGEKGIKLFVPTKATTFYRKGKNGKDVLTQLKNATEEEKAKIKSGQIPSYEKTFYKIGTVFDAMQTDMPKEKYPELYPNRHQDFDIKNPEQLNTLEKGLKQVAKDMGMPVITYSHDLNNAIADPQNAKGYFNTKTQQIVLNQYNTPTENVTVLAHELGHAQLHNEQKQENKLPRELKEMQAELTSYLYSSHYGIDTKKEAISYIADWTENGKKFNELPTGVKGQVLTHVSSATKVLTKATDKVLEKQKARTKEKVLENPVQTKEIKSKTSSKKELAKQAFLRKRGLKRE